MNPAKDRPRHIVNHDIRYTVFINVVTAQNSRMRITSRRRFEKLQQARTAVRITGAWGLKPPHPPADRTQLSDTSFSLLFNADSALSSILMGLPVVRVHIGLLPATLFATNLHFTFIQ